MMEQRSLLDEIIESRRVETVFQPIADLSGGGVIGYEAFSRGPEGSDLYMPLNLISEAKRVGKIGELDSLLSDNILSHAQARGVTGLLFINLDTRYLFEKHPSKAIRERLVTYGMKPAEIVIEFSDYSAITRFDSFVDVVRECRQDGFLICFDNVESANGNLFTLSKIRPDFMKTDRDMIEGIENDAEKQSAMKTKMMIAELVDTRVIAASVETEAELKTLAVLGVGAAQGRMIGAPEKLCGGIRAEAAEIIATASRVAADAVAKA